MITQRNPTARRRMVIAMLAGSCNGHGIGAAAEVAGLLGLSIEGLYIEDESLISLASLPFIREIETVSFSSRTLDPAVIENQMRLAARTFRRRLELAAGQARTSWRFENVRGEVAAIVARSVESDDIVAVLEPGGAMERAAYAAVSMRRAAIRSAGSVLYVPTRARWRAGPVVALVQSADSAVLDPAAHVAAATGDPLILLLAGKGGIDTGLLEARCKEMGIEAAQLAIHTLADATRASLERILAPIEERLIVLDRGALGLNDEATLMALAALHKAPVLAVEPRGREAKRFLTE